MSGIFRDGRFWIGAYSAMALDRGLDAITFGVKEEWSSAALHAGLVVLWLLGVVWIIWRCKVQEASK